MERRERAPIAIIGMGCRFPGGVRGPRSFWSLLEEGRDGVREVPADRWPIDEHYDPEPGIPGRTYSRWGGFLDDIERFEPEVFGISPNEAPFMDPQQRLLLEVCREALQDAGQTADRLAGSATGVFVGISTADYGQLSNSGSDTNVIHPHSATGSAFSIAANRISYCFDLRGPSVAVDTACSSSLVSTHLACQSLWSGECDLALSAGVNVLLLPYAFIAFSAATMLSPDGRCKAFDASANGFVRGEGAGVAVLKPLEAALADGDPIWATILATGTNQDGRTQGITLPNGAAQADLLRRVYKQAGVAPAEVDYVEAHGPGTAVGDPIEANAVGSVLSEGREADHPLVIGSVKTNIGHLEAGAGIAGLLKTTLAIHHRAIPRNLHFETPNPDIDFEGLRLHVPQSLEKWNPRSGRPIAGVNSFGFGGSNAHIVLAGIDVTRNSVASTADRSGPLLLPLSARTPDALTATASRLGEWLSEPKGGSEESLADVCHTAATRRDHLSERLALVVRDRAHAQEQLAAFAAGKRPPGVSVGRALGASKLAFVFAGQGPQWWGMGRKLLSSHSGFRSVVETCDEIHTRHAGWSLVEELMRDEDSSRMHETSIAQPALFALQVGLLEVMRQWGIEPEAVVGHSVGEIAAAHAAGLLSLEEGVRTIYERGRLMDRASSHGRMLAVGLPADEAEEWTRGVEDRVSLAAVNGPRSSTLSGDPQALEQIAAQLEARDIFCRFLKVVYAFHSPQMDPIEPELRAALAHLKGDHARLPFYSSVSGDLWAGGDLGAEYWWQNVRQPVQFAAAVDAMVQEGFRTFLELSPHPTLLRSVQECLEHRSQKGAAIGTLQRGEDDTVSTWSAAGALFTRGHPPDWARLNPGSARCVRLPVVSWDREEYWHEPESSRRRRLGVAAHPLLGQRQTGAQISWQRVIDPRVVRYLGDHRVRGNIVFPAAGYVEMALALAREQFGPGPATVEAMKLHAALFLEDGERASRLQLTFDPEDGGFEIHAAQIGSDTWTLHASGVVGAVAEGSEGPVEPFDALFAEFSQQEAESGGYDRLTQAGLDYGAAFRGVQRLWRRDGEALGEVELAEGVDPSRYRLHPALLDSCLHVFAAALPRDTGDQLYLPVGIERLNLFAEPGRRVWSHARITSCDDREVTGRVDLLDENGSVLVRIEGFRCQAIGSADEADLRRPENWLYELAWLQRPIEGAPAPCRNASFLPNPSCIAEELVPEGREMYELFARERDVTVRVRELDQMHEVYVWAALRSMGWDPAPGEEWTLGRLVAELGIAEGRLDLARHVFRDLEKLGGIVGVGEDRWIVQSTPPIADPDEAWRGVIEAFPDITTEAILASRAGRNLPAVLRGEIDPLEVLFPGGSTATLEDLYQSSASCVFSNMLAARAVRRAVAPLPAGRSLRILEVGAGTGGLTRHLLPELPAEKTEYVFADISPVFFQRARQKLRAFPFVEFEVLDIERDPLEQGFAAHSFDIVVAANVLHTTRDLRESLGHIRQLLASEGLLLGLEIDRCARWADLVFGLTDGWWRFEDRDLRPDYPLLERDAWFELLAAEGFLDPLAAPTPLDDEPFRQVVFLARGPELADQALASAEGEGAPPDLAEAGSWLVFADQGGVADDLERALAASGAAMVRVTPGERSSYAGERHRVVRAGSGSDIEELLGSPPADGWRGVIHLWSLDDPVVLDERTLARAEALGPQTLVSLLQAWERLEIPLDDVTLCLVTRGAQPVGGTDRPISLAQTPLIGIGRVIGSEYPEMRVKLVDLDPDDPHPVTRLLEELRTDDPEEEVALRADSRLVPRIQRKKAELVRVGAASDRPSYRLEPSRSGVIDQLSLRECPRHEPLPGCVEIEVRAAALNFRDVLKALSLYPTEQGDAGLLGDEAAGVISRVGEGVDDLKVGDAVVGVGMGSLGSHLVTPAACVMRKPERLSFEAAATVPVAFATAFYALRNLAQLAPGERVLIHAAAGGVGLAAVQIARHLGAEVLATASEAKRDFLHRLGVEHVMDSRSLEFADEVAEITGGAGVDVVLNSLAGRAIAKGIECLGPYGRFIELGKRDIYDNLKIGLWPFRRNLSFHAVDLSTFMTRDSERFGELLSELSGLVESRALHPLPHRVLSAAHVVDGFHQMAQGQHVGKVVVRMDDPDVRVAVSHSDAKIPAIRSDASYIISGGFGGFGLVVARWLASRGARHLLLLGRSGASSEDARSALGELRAAGVEVLEGRADVSCRDQLGRVLADARQTLPPIRGVFQVAMVMDDAAIVQLEPERVSSVMRPKVQGSWNLHLETLDADLDYFVCFGSAASVFANPGQASYTAANIFQDSLAVHRRALGLPATTISWGHLGQVGYVSQDAGLTAFLERTGFVAFTPEQGISMLERVLVGELPHVVVAPMNWGRWADSLADASPARRFVQMVGDGVGNADDDAGRGRIREAINRADPAERAGLVYTYLVETLSHALACSPEDLDPDQLLDDAGLDSLMAIELKNRIEVDLAVNLPMGEVLREPSLRGLHQSALRQLGISKGTARVGQPTRARVSDQAAEQVRLLPLRGDGEGPPIFCIHDISGRVGVYRHLIDALPAGPPILGLESGLLNGAEAPDDFEDMSRRYADAIRRHQLQGPYHLLGYSLGGFLATSIARQLESDGERVSFLGLVESDPCSRYSLSEKTAFRMIGRGLFEMLEAEVGVGLDAEAKHHLHDLDVFVEQLTLVDPRQRAAASATWAAEAGLLPDGMPSSAVERYLEPFFRLSELLSGYVPQPIEAPIFAWWALDTDWHRAEYPWHVLGGKPVAEETLPGGHFDVMRPPGVGALAKQLAEVLVRISRAGPDQNTERS